MYGSPLNPPGLGKTPRNDREAHECLCMPCKMVSTDRERAQAVLDATSRRLAYWIAGLAAVALLALLLFVPRNAKAGELFVQGGEARYARCERAGCWQQPPLPYEFNTSTGAVALGVRLGEWELAARDLGRVGVYGFFVADHEYNPQAKALRDTGEPVRFWRGNVQQRTRGVSLIYAPRWHWGRADLTVGAGAFLYRSEASIEIDYVDGGCCSTHLERADVRVTPAVKAAAGYWLTDALSVAVGLEWLWRVNYHDLPLGGTESTRRPGVSSAFIAVRWSL